MSAIARYYKRRGGNVSGYDRSSGEMTDALKNEGIDIHFEDNIDLIPDSIKNGKGKDDTIVIYTPAVPTKNKELDYFKSKGYRVYKRAEVLGNITKNMRTIAVAGTHGKTTVSSMIAHILKRSKFDCSAFLGGIAKNYNSNLLLSDKSKYVVVEADEYDRSFLHLYPDTAVITSLDPDHLDIYGDESNIRNTFLKFTEQIQPNGKLVIKDNVNINVSDNHHYQYFTYSSGSKADFYPENILLEDGLFRFDIVTPSGRLEQIISGFPGKINIENTVAAVAVAYLTGVSDDEIRDALKDFKGNRRRFDFRIKTDRLIYIDDYAHHPAEIRACIDSVRELYPGRKITGIFQPHLYTRTRDLLDGFVKSLEGLDELILLDIYPAREQKIEGVSSKIILDKVSIKEKILCSGDEALEIIKNNEPEILLTLGAGDIDQLVEPIEDILKKLQDS